MNKHEIDYYEENRIAKLLMYRKIIKVEDDTLYLDNGTELQICPNEGCGGCSSGNYYLTELNDCENTITDVQFCCDEIDFEEKSYKIFVFAENKKIKILQVDGDDGNGWYGTGYSIIVKEKEVQ